MNTFKSWDLLDSLPTGWSIDKHAGSPLSGYLFATNGSPLRGGKRALVRVAPEKKLIFETGAICSKTEVASPCLDRDQKPTQVIDASCAKTVNELARAKFVHKLLADILVDLTICEIEGWDKREYLSQLAELINGMVQQTGIPTCEKIWPSGT